MSQTAQPQSNRGMTCLLIGLAVLLATVVFIVIVAIGLVLTQPQLFQQAADIPPTAIVQQPATAIPSPSPVPTLIQSPPTPTATAILSPTQPPLTDAPITTYTEPVILADIQGQGNAVTDNYNMPACTKAVFYWWSGSDEYGTASLIATLNRIGSDRQIPIANEFNMDNPDSISGSTFQSLVGGDYFFNIENTDGPWSLRIECQDGATPVAAGLDITGQGNTVTPNYALAACQKSVFHWSVDPDTSGTAALILYLHQIGTDRYADLANAFDMDMTGPLQGQTLEPIPDGIYFLTIENATGLWHIRHECQD